MNTAAGRITTGQIGAFVLITLIWGSTWLVIKDQIGSVPAGWSVTWRFALAAAGMFTLALIRRESLGLSPAGWRLAALIGVFQFCGNFQLVYRSEHYVTSGLVAVLFALLIVPNASLGRIMLGTRVGPRFIAGSALALLGIALLLLHEYRATPAGGGAVLIGIALVGAAIMVVSVANVLQAGDTARAQPRLAFIAWSMALGTLANALLALGLHGPPVFDPRAGYVWGVAYLALAGSVVTFPLYFMLIREWGPGKAAYNGVLVPVVAMALSTAFEGYRWSFLAAGGAALALIGMLVALSGRD